MNYKLAGVVLSRQNLTLCDILCAIPTTGDTCVDKKPPRHRSLGGFSFLNTDVSIQVLFYSSDWRTLSASSVPTERHNSCPCLS